MKFHHISDGKNITKNNRQKITARGKSLSRKHASLAPFAVLAVFAVAAISSPILATSSKSYADAAKAAEIQKQIDGLNAQNANYSTQVSQLALQAGSIQAAITALQNQQAQIQTQIDASNAKIADLNAKIAVDDQQIKDQSQALVTTLQNIYYDSQSNSTLNILMNSNSISDYVDAQARQDGIQSNLQKSIDNINSLKKQLADQKAQVQTLLNTQVSQKQTLVASQAEQQSLESANQAQQADFNSKVAANKEALITLSQEKRDALGDGGTVVLNPDCAASANYPFCNDSQDQYDSAGGFKASGNTRECVNYVQWRIYEITRTNENHGNAGDWPITSHTPQSGDVVVYKTSLPGSGGYGHVAWVESVSGDSFKVSEYNVHVDSSGRGLYSSGRVDYYRGSRENKYIKGFYRNWQ